jgi:hypothetical protein
MEHFFFSCPGFIYVLDLVSQIRDVILMNVYLDLGNPGGSGLRNERYMNNGREMGRSVYEQPGNKVDGSCHSKEGSKKVRGDEWGEKGNGEKGSKEARGLLCNSL